MCACLGSRKATLLCFICLEGGGGRGVEMRRWMIEVGCSAFKVELHYVVACFSALQCVAVLLRWVDSVIHRRIFRQMRPCKKIRKQKHACHIHHTSSIAMRMERAS